MFVKPTKIVNTNNIVGSTIRNWYMDYHREMGGKVHPIVPKMLSDGIIIGFNENDFINPNSYKGATSLYKCKSTRPKFHKMYFGKQIGIIHLLGFKIVDYDHSMNYLLPSKMEFLHILKGKMIEEFPEYPLELYDENHVYNRDWENIKGISPQEKIVLANIHNEEPFPNSFYENDWGSFSNRTQTDEYNTRLESEISVDIRDYDIRDYENDGFNDIFEVVDNIIREREITFNEARDGFDYGDYQEFSDIYTRTKTSIEDFELYPVRVNGLPKALKKRGKSPYDTKLGVLEYRWFDYYQKPIDTWAEFLKENPDWKFPTSPKYDWEMSDEERELNDYDLPDNFWEEIEMAYQQR